MVKVPNRKCYPLSFSTSSSSDDCSGKVGSSAGRKDMGTRILILENLELKKDISSCRHSSRVSDGSQER